jgi:hypothetical protein
MGKGRSEHIAKRFAADLFDENKAMECVLCFVVLKTLQEIEKRRFSGGGAR